MCLKIHLKFLRKYKLTRWYVYIHKTNEGNVYYVGKGTGNRCKSLKRSPEHQNVRINFGMNIEIIYYTYDEHDAYEKEKQFIKFYHTSILDKDRVIFACNKDWGGQAFCVSDEAKVRGRIKSNNHPIHIELGIKLGKMWKGRKRSKEQCLSQSKQISLFDKDDNFICTTDSIKEMSEKTGISQSYIQKCYQSDCLCHGYKFRIAKLSDKLLPQQEILNINYDQRIKYVTIYKFDLQGKFIKSYESFYEAYKDVASNTHIRDCCLGKRKHSNGFIWKFASDVNFDISDLVLND